MNPILHLKIRILGSLCVLSCCTALFAVTNDTGPLGAKASGAATPDASTLSKMQLLNAPKPSSATAQPGAPLLPKRKAKSHALWLQSQAIRVQIAGLDKSKRLDTQESGEAKSDLNGILDKYRLTKEADVVTLKPTDQRRLQADLDALAARLNSAPL